MSKAGRPPLGLGHVERAPGSAHAKKRLKAILQTLCGARTVREAARELGVTEAAFYELRAAFLRQSLAGLEPRPRGRKPAEPSAEAAQIESLRDELVRARLEIEALELREEIAILLPHLLRPRQKGGKAKDR